jgi:hypothetical protein
MKKSLLYSCLIVTELIVNVLSLYMGKMQVMLL